MDILESTQCALKSHYIIVEKISFSRKDEIELGAKLKSEFSRRVEKLGDGCSKIVLDLKIVSSTEDFELFVSVAGKFEVINCENDTIKDELLNRNTVSILFPYLRSEVTLITAQPTFKPIILPPINIAQLLDDLDNNE